jgi:hypothetical protein
VFGGHLHFLFENWVFSSFAHFFSWVVGESVIYKGIPAHSYLHKVIAARVDQDNAHFMENTNDILSPMRVK